jgi:hypothetical protein
VDNFNCLKCNKKIDNFDIKYGLHTACFTQWFYADPLDDFLDVQRKNATSSPIQGPSRAPWNSSFFHGKFLKYAANLAGKSYIIKLQETFAPELPFVEYLSNQIAQILDIETPPFYCILFYGTPAFLSQNLFEKTDRIKTLTHIYHYVPSGKEYDCETLIKIILKETNQGLEVEKFIDICLFDALIGNHDRHGRNLGLLIEANGATLCPAYDNTSALGLEQGNMLKAAFSPRGKIATQHTLEPTAKDYVDEFVRLNYLHSVKNFIHRVDLSKIETFIQHSHCSELMKSAFFKLIESRYEEMKNAL